MNLFDELRNLDFHNVGGWSKSVRIFFMVIVFAVVVFVGWYVEMSNQKDELVQAQKQEIRLKQDFSRKQAKAANLDELQEQLKKMQVMLKQLLRQLPSKTEMPQLLKDISQTALAAGIDPQVFHPERENNKGFYAEQPITLKMVGTYHQFGTFISDVASLPHVVILTMHNVSLRPLKDTKGSFTKDQKLVLQGTVKTYRYRSDDENGRRK